MSQPANIDGLQSFAFGDSPGMADRLLALVIDGSKTASCAPVRDLTPLGDEPMPVAGHRYVVLDGQQRPAAVIETLDVVIRRFDEVTEDFARAEGEGDFAKWREGHKAFFERNGGWSPDLQLACERFKLVGVLPR